MILASKIDLKMGATSQLLGDGREISSVLRTSDQAACLTRAYMYHHRRVTLAQSGQGHKGPVQLVLGLAQLRVLSHEFHNFPSLLWVAAISWFHGSLQDDYYCDSTCVHQHFEESEGRCMGCKHMHRRQPRNATSAFVSGQRQRICFACKGSE